VPCADSSPFARPRLGPKAKIPNYEGTRLRFALDSPLEQRRFELSVPPGTPAFRGAPDGSRAPLPVSESRRCHRDPGGSADPVDFECRSCAHGSGRVPGCNPRRATVCG
jgi:hypothetical protein